MQWTELLAEINQNHRTTFALEERYAAGEQGAWAIVDSELQRLVATHQATPHRKQDIVLGDFQHANILAHNDQISGVVDWDHVQAGDSVFDIATLLFYAYDDGGVREQLWHYALERANLNLLSVYLAHLILRQVDWSLRHHNQPTIDRYLQRSITLLVDIRHRSRLTRSHFSHGNRSR